MSSDRKWFRQQLPACALRLDLAAQLGSLADLAHTHRRTPTVARTLTQPAIPTTFGVKAAVWLDTVCDAAEAVEHGAMADLCSGGVLSWIGL